MNKLFRALIAGYGAKKLGGGCFSTILIFILIYWALGNCNSSKAGAIRPSSVIHERKVSASLENTKMQSTTTYILNTVARHTK